MNDFSIENTVLFFPFSCFKIKNIDEENENYILGYLGDKNEEDKNGKIRIDNEPNKVINDFIGSNLASDSKIKETYPSLLVSKSTIIGEFKINKEQVRRKMNLINPNKRNIKDYVEILGDSEQKQSIRKEFNKKGEYTIYYNFSENFDKNLHEIPNPEKFEIFKYLFKSIEIQSLDLSKLKMGNVTSVESMFSECKNLTSIDLSNKELKKLEDLSRMFYNCFSLESVNLENFTSKEIKYMDYMFYHCKSLKHINLKNLEFERNVSISNIFFGVNKECEIEVENDDIKKEFNKIKNK